jgi:hypothetical protein
MKAPHHKETFFFQLGMTLIFWNIKFQVYDQRAMFYKFEQMMNSEKAERASALRMSIFL